MGNAKEKSFNVTKDGDFCSNCGEYKTWDCFDKKTKSKDGSQLYMRRCKVCRADLRLQNLIKLNSKNTAEVNEFEVFELEADDYIKHFLEKELRDIAIELIFGEKK